MTMKLISTVTITTTGVGGIDFDSIPATFTDLICLVSARSASGGSSVADMLVRFNDSTSGYTERYLLGNGSSASSSSFSGNGDLILKGSVAGSSSTSNTFGNTSIYIPNYTGATNKSVSTDGVNENNATTANQNIQASLWSNTAAITKIRIGIYEGSGVNLAVGTTASLYGIQKGSGGATVA